MLHNRSQLDRHVASRAAARVGDVGWIGRAIRRGGGLGRGLIGTLVVVAVAFGGPLHLWLAHGSGHVPGHTATPAAVLAVAHGHDHYHGHDHHHHDDHRGQAACDADHDHAGHDHSGPCQDPVEECDLCLAISFSAPFLSATIEVPGGVVSSEPPAAFEGTTRDIWGPATASSRGPPRRA